MTLVKKTKVVDIEEVTEIPTDEGFKSVAPQNIGKLDMVIAFDTTGSMAQYIGAVRKEVADLIPQLFKDNDNLRLGIVAFGDYCDMEKADSFGDAYQVEPLTNDENGLIKFVLNSKDTSGGDGPEFYELVIKKIVEETNWREDSQKSILLIADAVPHELGYSYENIIQGNQIDWRTEAIKAANKKIKIDTVRISHEEWFKELSAITNGVSVPFMSSSKTSHLVRASVLSRGSIKARMAFDECMAESRDDEELNKIYHSFMHERKKL